MSASAYFSTSPVTSIGGHLFASTSTSSSLAALSSFSSIGSLYAGCCTDSATAGIAALLRGVYVVDPVPSIGAHLFASASGSFGSASSLASLAADDGPAAHSAVIAHRASLVAAPLRAHEALSAELVCAPRPTLPSPTLVPRAASPASTLSTPALSISSSSRAPTPLLTPGPPPRFRRVSGVRVDPAAMWNALYADTGDALFDALGYSAGAAAPTPDARVSPYAPEHLQRPQQPQPAAASAKGSRLRRALKRFPLFR